VRWGTKGYALKTAPLLAVVGVSELRVAGACYLLIYQTCAWYDVEHDMRGTRWDWLRCTGGNRPRTGQLALLHSGHRISRKRTITVRTKTKL
jgi:hypothetical protein